MAREWGSGVSGSGGNRTMDETLIEVFGCVSLDAMITGFDTDRLRGAADFSLPGNGMDETLIEVFGCVSLAGRVVWLDTSRERKADRAGLKGYPIASRREGSLRVKYH